MAVKTPKQNDNLNTIRKRALLKLLIEINKDPCPYPGFTTKEGVFREAGSRKVRAEIMEKVITGADIVEAIHTIAGENPDIHTIASIIKELIRDLRDKGNEPLIKAMGQPIENLEQIDKLIVTQLLICLGKVLANSNTSLMNANNLATVFGPNMYPSRTDNDLFYTAENEAFETLLEKNPQINLKDTTQLETVIKELDAKSRPILETQCLKELAATIRNEHWDLGIGGGVQISWEDELGQKKTKKVPTSVAKIHNVCIKAQGDDYSTVLFQEIGQIIDERDTPQKIKDSIKAFFKRYDIANLFGRKNSTESRVTDYKKRLMRFTPLPIEGKNRSDEKSTTTVSP